MHPSTEEHPQILNSTAACMHLRSPRSPSVPPGLHAVAADAVEDPVPAVANLVGGAVISAREQVDHVQPDRAAFVDGAPPGKVPVRGTLLLAARQHHSVMHLQRHTAPDEQHGGTRTLCQLRSKHCSVSGRRASLLCKSPHQHARQSLQEEGHGACSKDRLCSPVSSEYRIDWTRPTAGLWVHGAVEQVWQEMGGAHIEAAHVVGVYNAFAAVGCERLTRAQSVVLHRVLPVCASPPQLQLRTAQPFSAVSPSQCSHCSVKQSLIDIAQADMSAIYTRSCSPQF